MLGRVVNRLPRHRNERIVPNWEMSTNVHTRSDTSKASGSMKGWISARFAADGLAAPIRSSEITAIRRLTLRFPVVGERKWPGYDVFGFKINFSVRRSFGEFMRY